MAGLVNAGGSMKSLFGYTNREFVDVDFSGADFLNVFENVDFTFCKMQDMFCIKESVFIDCRFTFCDMTDAEFAGAEFAKCQFTGCNMPAARFEYCEFKETNIVRCNLKSADFLDCVWKCGRIEANLLKSSVFWSTHFMGETAWGEMIVDDYLIEGDYI